MCPPAQCCCCRIYEGVKTWTIVFIVLGSLGVVGRIGLAAWAGSFCTDENIDLGEALDRAEFCHGDEEWWVDALAGEEPTSRYEILQQHQYVGAAVGAAVVVVHVCGLKAVQQFQADGIRKFWQQAFALSIVNWLVDVVYMARANDYSNIVGFAIGVGLTIWWVYAIKALGDQVASGSITAANPMGGGAQGIQMQGVPMQAQPVMATATVVQPGMAQAQPVMAQATVVAKP